MRFFNRLLGKTDIQCFNDWTRELIDTGYLHNHARMWFASIWIFTLKLPWQLGADFFLEHLLDADAASNTLSWRWVAGLHTPGKHYVARAENISKFTKGRYHPHGQLNENPRPLPMDCLYEKTTLSLPQYQKIAGRLGYLILPDDLSPPPVSMGKIVSTAGFIPSSLITSPLVSTFIEGAIKDALSRYEGTELKGDFSQSLLRWIAHEKLDAIVMPYPTVGYCNDLINHQRSHIPIYHTLGHWDRNLWPHASSGFFRFKSSLPQIYSGLMQ